MNPLTSPGRGGNDVSICSKIQTYLSLWFLECIVEMWGSALWGPGVKSVALGFVLHGGGVYFSSGYQGHNICSYQGLCQVFVYCPSGLAEICGDRELNCHHQEVLAGVCQASFITE